MVEKDKIILARDGVFPITRNAKGEPVSSLPNSGLCCPGTIQGEGKLNGIPSLFIRLAGCNLHCIWTNPDGSLSPCDTAYASYHIRQARSCTLEEICRLIGYNTGVIDHLVITGGEPLLQYKELTELCIRLKKIKKFHITLETNATLYAEELATQIDFFSLSPKLAGSIPPPPQNILHDKQRLSPETIQKFISHTRTHNKDFQLKFVYSQETDITEIKTLLSCLTDWKKEDVLLMPQGGNSRDVEANIQQTLRHCIENGWRYCDRLHLALFGSKEGV